MALAPCREIPSTSSLSKIYVGSSEIQEKITTIFNSTIEARKDPSTERLLEQPLFVRDWRVVRLDGSHLIPSSLDSTKATLQLKAMMPLSSILLIQSCAGHLGQGLRAISRKEAIQTCEDLGIRYETGKTAIEGGNCLLFMHEDNTPRALIGIHSLFLSYMTIEESGYFLEKEEELAKLTDAITPSEESIRIARNIALSKERIDLHAELAQVRENRDTDLHIYQAKLSEIQKKLFKLPTETAWKASLLTPPSDADKETYRLAAAKLEACLELTKSKIAEEIGVPQDKIAFLLQNDFHIDLETSPIPGSRQVLVHDEQSVIGSLSLIRVNRIAQKILDKYLTSSKACLASNQEILRINGERLKAIGCEMLPIAGNYDSPSAARANFINGIWVQNKGKLCFLTNDADMPQLNKHFSDTMHELFPHIDIRFIDHRYIGTSSGGIHCLTWM